MAAGRGNGIDIQMKLTVNPGVLNSMFNDKNGFVGSIVQLNANAVLAQARANVTGRRYSGHHPGLRLADSGRIQPTREDPSGPSWSVVFEHPIAVVHHQGSVGHSIGSPGRRLTNLNIDARSAGGPFHAIGPVFHKGANANPYLINAAKTVGLRLGGALRQGQSIAFPVTSL